MLPELCITGYTCGDLFLQKTLLDAAAKSLWDIAAAAQNLDMLIFLGLPVAVSGRLYNCAAVLWRGEILGLVPKRNIPNYSEFYEKRYFTPASNEHSEIVLDGKTVLFSTKLLFCHDKMPELVVGAELCEDLWVPDPPSVKLAMAGATVLVNLSASDEVVTKDEYRRELVRSQSARLVAAYLYADAGDGESTQDLVYTGHNLICENGATLAESHETSGSIYSEIDVHPAGGRAAEVGNVHRRPRRVCAGLLELPARGDKADAVFF